MTRTPGEWRTSPTNSAVVTVDAFVVDSTNQPIALVVADSNHGPANARLLAAAPELLEAIKGALDVLNSVIPGPHATIRAAIALAEPEPGIEA